MARTTYYRNAHFIWYLLYLELPSEYLMNIMKRNHVLEAKKSFAVSDL